MVPPVIIATVVFGDDVFRRMADVLEYSVARNFPAAEFVRIDAPAHEHIKGIPTHCPANAHKKSYWADVVQQNHNRRIIVIDCDTLVLGDLSHVFDERFDLAYTVRPHRIRVNAGVMFCRSTQATRRFFDKWNYTQEVLLSEEERSHLQARLKKFAGLDQAAFDKTLNAVDFPFETLELPCEKYNSVDQTWHVFNEQTCVLHVKGRLRRFAVVESADPAKHPTISEPMRVWQEYAAAAQQSVETI